MPNVYLRFLLSDTKSSLLLKFVITVHLTLINGQTDYIFFGKGKANSAHNLEFEKTALLPYKKCSVVEVVM